MDSRAAAKKDDSADSAQ